MCTVLTLAAIHALPAADYFVATTGNDSNNGTSVATPWRTIAHAVAYAGLTGGDTVYVRGGTYAEHAEIAKSGSAGNPLTVKAYAGETPIMDGNGLTPTPWPSHGGVLDVTGSHVVVDGLRVINSTVGADAIGILVRGPGVADVTVRNCSTDNTRSSGIAVWGMTSDYSGVVGVLIEKNTITNAVNDGYQECLSIANGVDQFEVRGNTVRDSYNAPHPPNIPLGIDAKVNVRNGKIHHNQVYNLAYCSGIYVDGWDSTAYNIDIYNNVIHHVAHGGIQVGAEEAGTIYNINIYNNLIYQTSENGFAINNSNIATPAQVRDIRFYHNTVYGCGYYAAHITVDAPNSVINNNIFSQNGWSNAVTVNSGNQANISMANNITDGAQNAWLPGQVIFKGSSSISQAPQFAWVGGGNFRLVAGSPAIDAGTASWAASNDLDDLARPSGAGYDVGAYEFGSTSANAAPTVALTAPANNATYTAPASVALSANASDSDGSVVRVEFWNGSSKLGEDTSSADGWTFNWSNVAAGSYTVTAKAFDNGSPALSTTSPSVTLVVNASVVAQSTYGNNGNPWSVPSNGTLRIEAENYDVGGEGVAYHDTDAGNNGGAYRSDDVDIHGISDAGGGYTVGWFGAGEWLEYTINVPTAGTYDLRLRVARGVSGNGALRLLADGVQVSSDLVIPATGGWDTWTNVDQLGIALTSGTHVLRVENSGGCNLNWMELKGLGLPAGWSTSDIGAVAAIGSAVLVGDTWTVTGSGADVWNTADEFQFAAQTLSGNGTIVARVASLQNTNAWAKAGVMIRESTATGSRHAFCCVTAGNGVAFQRRSTADGASAHTAGSTAAAPRWVKLERSGNVLTGFESANGTTWTKVGSATIAIGSSARFGLAVTSHADGTLATATFDHVSVTPTASN